MCNFTGKHVTILALCTFFVASAQAARVPLTFTGWNADLIASAGDTSPQTGTNTDFSNWILYGAGAASLSDGLPSGGSFNSLVDATPFQFASYGSNNAILNSGTLSLSSPAAYSDLSFLVLNGETFTATVTYTNSTTTVIHGTATSWVAAPNANTAIANFGVIARQSSFGSEYQAVQMQQFTASVDPTKQISAISFAGGREDGSDALFAISGTAAVPEPTSLAFMGAGFLVFGGIVRRKLS